MIHKYSFFNSLVFRSTLLFGLILVLAVSAGGYLVFQVSFRVIVSDAQKEMRHNNELLKSSLNSLLIEASNDIAIISKSAAVNAYIQDPSQPSLAAVRSSFQLALKHKPSYFQIRLIGKEDDGKELIRLEKKKGVITTTPADSLQQKGEKAYFVNSIHLPPNEFYISPLNLNEEHGKISLPHMPTIRLSKPVYEPNGSTFGVIVINISLLDFYAELAQMSPSNYTTYIHRDDGEIVFHPVYDSLQFCIQKGLTYSIEDELRRIDKSEETSLQPYERNSATVYGVADTLSSSIAGHSLILLTTVNESTIQKVSRVLKQEAISWLSLILVISLLIIAVFGYAISNRINRITNAIKTYSQGGVVELKKVENTSDEVAILTNGFLAMKATIDRQIKDLSFALDQARKAQKERDDFLQNMSHEMRTPLNAVLALTENLQHNRIPLKFMPIVEAMSRNIRILSILVYDVLDFKKLKDGEISLSPKSSNLELLANSIFKTYEFDALKKGLSLNLKLSHEVKTFDFLTDELRLSQIITNLLNNSIKYTEEGYINLLLDYNESTEKLIIQVNDSGSGIEPTIVESFYKNDFKKVQPSEIHDSFGLGLAIVKHLVLLFNGKIRIDSNAELGTNIELKIPTKKLNRIRQSKAYYSLPTGTTLHAIHLEDDPIQQEFLANTLDFPWLKIKALGNEDIAFQEAKRGEYDLILSDLNIERNSITQKLNDLYSKLEIPIWVISGEQRPSDLHPAILYFDKPIQPAVIQTETFLYAARKIWHKPEITGLKEKYDFDPQKINRVLTLLVSELEKYEGTIQDLIDQPDLSTWNAFKHKIEVHSKELNLIELGLLLEKDSNQISVDVLRDVLSLLAYYRLELIKLL